MLHSTLGSENAVSTRQAPAADHCLDGYYFVQRVGEGGFGAVFEAVDLKTGEAVALKIPHDKKPRTVADFRREFLIARRFRHPNVAPVIDIVTSMGAPVLVYPLAKKSVGDYLDEEPLSCNRALRWAGQLLDGLAHVHKRGFIHCDLKPDNLLVFPGDRLALTDFGLARTALEDCIKPCYSGTEEYMAPEHEQDGKVSPRSDVYEAALVIVEMLTGEVPERPIDDPLLERLADGRPCPPRVRAIEPVLERALEVEPCFRYADASAMAADFHHHLRLFDERQEAREATATSSRFAVRPRARA